MLYEGASCEIVISSSYKSPALSSLYMMQIGMIMSSDYGSYILHPLHHLRLLSVVPSKQSIYLTLVNPDVRLRSNVQVRL